MDQLDKVYETSIYLLPWSVFLIGLMGSFHCVGMCGGLVLSCTPKPKHNMVYQLGRLLSYSLLAVSTGYIGSYLQFPQGNPWIALVPAIIIGLYLVYLGVKLLLKNQSRFQMPKTFSKVQVFVWNKALPSQGEEVKPSTSFIIGSLSIFLPCGFLYGVILALAAYGSPILSLVCIFTFWLGTLPAVSMAPDLIKRILKPLYQRMPIVSSSFLILIGLITISHRVMVVYQETTQSCH